MGKRDRVCEIGAEMGYASEGNRGGNIRVATTVPSRLRGLLGTEPGNDLLVLAPCASIHTYGMRYSIDIAFVDRTGTVVLSRRAVEPGTCIGCRTASLAVERAHAPCKRWFELGDPVALVVDEPNRRGERL